MPAFADIERMVVDYFDRHDAKTEERGAEWFLVDADENTVSLTGLAAEIFRMNEDRPRGDRGSAG